MQSAQWLKAVIS